MAFILLAFVLLAIVLAVVSVAYPPFSHTMLVGAVLFLAFAVLLLLIRMGGPT